MRIQAEGLAKRMEHTHAKCAVVGISGGLDSCLALLVAVRACKVLGRDPKDIIAITMPCFGTTKRTRSNAEILCEALGVSFTEINITNTVESHFADIGQDPRITAMTLKLPGPCAHAGIDGLRQQERRLCDRHRRFAELAPRPATSQRRPHEHAVR